MSRQLLWSSLLILSVGCASTAAHQRTEGPGLSLGQQAGEPLLVQGASITGPTSSLLIKGDAMTGRFRNQPVSLEWTYQELKGVVGVRRTQLELAEGDDMRFRGTFGGAPVDLIVEQEWLQGRVGECSYALKRTPGGYSGQRSCGGALEEGHDLAFSEELLGRPLGERAALMTLMLVNYTETYTPSVSLARFARPRDISSRMRGCGALP